MRPIPGSEVRERFLRFFEERGHQRLPSDSLVPTDDPTLLFTGAGMNQFKDMFLGRGSLPYKRVTTSQKCLRVPDLDNVGRTPRHHTFFEMLGNFSFGDYFKQECIAWEWEFFTAELGFPSEQLCASIYTDDDEAFEIWRDVVGLAEEKIFRFGEKENFWPAEAPSKGPNGPCGPCSEIYYDQRPGEAYPARQGLTELPGDRFVEVGNCVFTQFDRQDGGRLEPLPQKNIDVGLGLERVVAVLQDAPNNFETDLFRPYLDAIAARSGSHYGEDAATDERMRRIADHARAVTFCIADGALPSNEGRGYVVRKILRRAARDGYELGVEGPFVHQLVDVVGEVMGDAYPEVREHAAQCRSLIKSEEESFATVYRQGMRRLREFLQRHAGDDAGHKRGAPSVLAGSGEFAFELHDTFGFPVDITRQVLHEAGHALDDAGFDAAMEQQRERARSASATSAAVFTHNAGTALRAAGVPATEFVGYRTLTERSRVRGLVAAGDRLVEKAGAGDAVQIVVEKSPFYAQGGGQVGDRGTVLWDGGRARVANTTALESFHLHAAEIVEGELPVGCDVFLEVDEPARRATERNHTATHLLHAALKNCIGAHVSQAGSEVAPERFRFDYTHGERLTDEQIRAIEDEVNRVILSAIPVEPVVRDLDEARAQGFVAMFGEKYGDRVRTLSVGDYSKELCGGTHVANSGSVGAFRIVSDSAISAGTRRIEAITGFGALEAARAERGSLLGMAQRLKVPVEQVPERVEALLEERKRLEKRLQSALAADVGKVLEELERAAEPGESATTAVFETRGLSMKEMQELLTRARQKLEPFAGVVIVRGEAEVLVGAAVSDSLTDRLQAGTVVKELATALGGGGGGRAGLAQGKGNDPTKVDDALRLGRDLLARAGL